MDFQIKENKKYKKIKRTSNIQFIYIVEESYGYQYEPNWPNHYYFKNNKDAKIYYDKLLNKYNKYLSDDLYILYLEILNKSSNNENSEENENMLDLLDKKLKIKYGKSKEKYSYDFYNLKIKKAKIN